MTTPRDALATALSGPGVYASPEAHADAALTALHAAGWTVARTEHARDGVALARLREAAGDSGHVFIHIGGPDGGPWVAIHGGPTCPGSGLPPKGGVR